MEKRIIKILPLICFFLTGASSLIDEIAWTKILSLIFGSSLIGAGLVLFIFMFFLFSGSIIGGKIASISFKPLKIYGLFEIITGIMVIFSPFVLEKIKEIAFKGKDFYAYLFSFITLIFPVTLMGSTFPIFLKSQRKNLKEYSKKTGLVYGLNLLGGSIGAILSGFYLIPRFGIKETLIFSGFLDIFAGIICVFLSKNFINKELEAEKLKISREEKKSIFIAFFGGVASLILEVAWFRMLNLFIGSSTYSFTLMVSSFLLGLFFGSFFLSKIADKKENVFSFLSLLHILISFFSTIVSITFLLVPYFYIEIIKITKAKFFKMNFLIFIFLFLIFLVPTSLIGSALPVAIKAGAGIRKSKSSGLIYASSSIGSAIGSISSSLLLIPNLGLKKTLIIAFSFSSIASLISNISSFKLKEKNLKILIICVILWFLWLFNFLPWNWKILTSGCYAYAHLYTRIFSKEEIKFRNLKIIEDFKISDCLEEKKPQIGYETKLLYLKEGIFSQVAVVEEMGIRSLLINGKVDASNGLEDMKTQILLGHLPCIFLDEIKGNALVIGIGSGVTTGAITTYNFNEIHAIEIEKEVLNASKFFKEENLNFFMDKRVKIIIGDARKEIYRLNKKFSVITSEPSNLWMSGVSFLFTYEFFKEIFNKLEENGIFCQWIHLYQIGLEDIKIFLNTISSVFPNLLIYSDGGDMLILASKNKIKIFREKLIEKINGNEKLRNWFGKVGFCSLSDLLKYFILDERGLKFFLKNEKINTDNYPVLEYSAAKNLGFDFSRKILKELLISGRNAGKIEFHGLGFLE